MATHTSAELGALFECDLSEGGLDEFEPESETLETQRGALWRRVASPTAVDLLRWEPYIAPAQARSWPLALPVVLAAVMAGVALSWLGLRGNERPAIPAAPAAARDVAAAEALPAAPLVSESVVPAAGTATAPAAPASATAPATLTLTAVNPALEATLAAVSRSYRDLDSAALAAVWPGADIASLEQSFSTLKYQTLSFDRCETRSNGPTGVLASCEVSIAAAPKSGDPALERRRQSWTLVLDSSGDRWTIAGVSIR